MKKIILSLIYPLCVRQFLRLIMGVHYVNREILRGAEQFIIVSNHNSHLDTMALMAALSWRQIDRTKPVAAGDYFGKTPIKKRITELFVNALLIPRSRPKEGETFADPIQLMVNALGAGHSLIIFPEGTRGEAGKIQKFKKGIGLVAQQCPHVPIIPVFMQGMGKLLPKGEMLLVPFDNFVRFGTPFYCGDLPVEDIVARVEKEIMALAEVQ